MGRIGTRPGRVPTVVVARRRERLEALAQRHAGFDVLVADLTTDAGQRVVAERIAAGPIDLVVNNAGFGTAGPFHELDPARLTRACCARRRRMSLAQDSTT